MPLCSNCGSELAEAQTSFCPHCGTQIIAGPDRESLLGRTINGKYRIVSKIGSGSMGTVYKAEHISLKKTVALKVLHPDLPVHDESLQRLQREGIAAGKFTHANAIQIFDFDRSEGGHFYLAMEYVEGQTLAQWLEEHGRLLIPKAIHLCSQLLGVLAEAHLRGIVHRDLKPDNLMVMEQSTGELMVKVLDFGLSKLVHVPLQASLHTQTGRIIGTPLYMSPEQCSGAPVDHRCDLYAVGLILYEAISGRPAFEGETIAEILYKHTAKPPPSLLENNPQLEVPEDLEAIVQKALAKRPEDRFESATEMLNALMAVRFDRLAKHGQKATQVLPAAGTPGGARRSFPWVAAVLTVAVIALVGWVSLTLLSPAEVSERDSRNPTRAVAASEPRVRELKLRERTPQQQEYLAVLDKVKQEIAAGNLFTARELADRALAFDCRDAEAYFARAMVFRKNDEPNAALLDLDEALRRNRNYIDAMVERGWALFDLNRHDAAYKQFRSARELASDSAGALAGFGVTSFLRGESEAALADLKRAEKLDPELGIASRYLGQIKLEQGLLEEAHDHFVAAKRADAGDWKAMIGLAKIYERQGDPEKAASHYKRALRENDQAREARRSLAYLALENGSINDAIRQFEEVIKADPDTAANYFNLAALQQQQGEDREAIRNLEAGLEREPMDAPVWTLHGMLLLQQGNHLEAVEKFDWSLGIDPGQGLPAIYRGICLFQLGHHLAAAESLKAGLAKEPDHLQGRLTLGILCLDYLEDLDAALKHFEQFVAAGGEESRVEALMRQCRARKLQPLGGTH